MVRGGVGEERQGSPIPKNLDVVQISELILAQKAVGKRCGTNGLILAQLFYLCRQNNGTTLWNY